MQYISASEASVKWNITVRRIQQLCNEDRIPGVRKMGRTWMIPANMPKPNDPRRARHTGYILLPYTPLTAVAAFMPDRVKEATARMPEGDQRAQFECELAYLRGDFNAAKTCLTRCSPDSPIRICALMMGGASAGNDGDYALFTSVAQELSQITHKYRKNPDVARLAELASATMNVSICDAHVLPDWLTRGDFSPLAPSCRPMALYIYAKHLHRIGHYDIMLGATQAALALRNAEIYTAADLYIDIMHAMACVNTGNAADAEKSIRHAMDIALPGGFITPFAEHVKQLCGVVEKCLEDKKYRAWRDVLIEQYHVTTCNWGKVYDHTAHENIALVLTHDEYRAAVFARDGLPATKIGELMGLTPLAAAKLLHSVFNKLGITKKSELRQFMN